ncbi:hypothetical protein KAR48_06520 [bacterium]|nr:hypothetical protein [bacterium]
MKILHFAVENFARVPETFVRAERELGHDSTLMTLYPTKHQFDDGAICLNMPFVGDEFASKVKKLLKISQSNKMSNQRRNDLYGPPVWNPGSGFKKALFELRDNLWEPRIRKALEKIDINSFDLIYFDGGAGFLRSGKIAKELKEQGHYIGINYCGSDLRTRGIIDSVDKLADARFTVEFDHSLLYPAAEFLFFPFRLSAYSKPDKKLTDTIRIGHAPTNRIVKGTDYILAELEGLKADHPIEIVLIENLSHPEALKLKASCDIFIDNIGELGYGINSLESLAMGVPTAVQLLPDFEAVLGKHPFINIQKGTIATSLQPYLKSSRKRRALADIGKGWVKLKHDPVKIVKKMLSRFS